MQVSDVTKNPCDAENCFGQAVADRLCERHWWQVEQTMTTPVRIPDSIRVAEQARYLKAHLRAVARAERPQMLFMQRLGA